MSKGVSAVTFGRHVIVDEGDRFFDPQGSVSDPISVGGSEVIVHGYFGKPAQDYGPAEIRAGALHVAHHW